MHRRLSLEGLLAVTAWSFCDLSSTKAFRKSRVLKQILYLFQCLKSYLKISEDVSNTKNAHILPEGFQHFHILELKKRTRLISIVSKPIKVVVMVVVIVVVFVIF